MDSSPKEKNQGSSTLEPLEQRDLTDMYGPFPPKTATEYIFSSSAYRTFSRIDHMLGHKTN